MEEGVARVKKRDQSLCGLNCAVGEKGARGIEEND